MKNKMVLLLKLTFVALLLVFLAKKGFLSLSATQAAFHYPGMIIPAFALIIFTTIISVIRWRWLLSAQKIQLSFAEALELTLIGSFFNFALPGAVSGDFVKAYYIGDKFKEKRAAAFGAILFDRVLGLSGLVLVAVAALFFNFKSFMGTTLMSGVKFSIICAGIGVIVFYAYLFLVKEHHDPVLIFLKKMEGKSKAISSATRIYLGVREYHTERLLVSKAIAVSLVTHSSVAFACILFSHALLDPSVTPEAFFVVVPLGLLVTAVPVMPGGVGTGHAAFGYLFHLLGLNRGADIFSLFLICQLLVAGAGGLVYLRYKGSHSKPVFTPSA